jgi:hypothetical protein
MSTILQASVKLLSSGMHTMTYRDQYQYPKERDRINCLFSHNAAYMEENLHLFEGFPRLLRSLQNLFIFSFIVTTYLTIQANFSLASLY